MVTVLAAALLLAAAGCSSSARVPPPSSTSPAPIRSTTAPAPSGSSAAAQPLRTVVVDDGAGHGWRVAVWANDHSGDCLAFAYGAPVRQYLATHYCRGVGRVLAATTVDGRPVAIAQEYAGFANPPSWNGQGTPPSYGYASDFAVLLSRDGTGGLRSLLADGARFPGSGTDVRYPNAFDATSQDSGAEMAEVWYLDGPTPANQPVLVGLARAVFLQLG